MPNAIYKERQRRWKWLSEWGDKGSLSTFQGLLGPLYSVLGKQVKSKWHYRQRRRWKMSVLQSRCSEEWILQIRTRLWFVCICLSSRAISPLHLIPAAPDTHGHLDSSTVTKSLAMPSTSILWSDNRRSGSRELRPRPSLDQLSSAQPAPVSWWWAWSEWAERAMNSSWDLQTGSKWDTLQFPVSHLFAEISARRNNRIRASLVSILHHDLGRLAGMRAERWWNRIPPLSPSRLLYVHTEFRKSKGPRFRELQHLNIPLSCFC